MVKYIYAEQHESLLNSANSEENEFNYNHCSDQIIINARNLSLVTHNLVEEVIGFIRKHSIDGRTHLDSEAIEKFKIIGNAVKKAKDDLIISVKETIEEKDLESKVLNKKFE